MKLKIVRLAFFLVIAAFLGCGKEFLEQPPRGSLTVGSFPRSESDALLAVNGCYNMLRDWQLNTGGFPLYDIMSDEATKGSNPGDGSTIVPFENFSFDASDGSIERWYKTMYEAVRRTNLVINEVPTIDMDPILKDRYIAEARFLRGYFYFELVKGFGDIPKVMVIDPPLTLGRTAADEIMRDVVYPDLEYAVALLPERSQYETSDLGRVTKGAARAMLARAHLFDGNYEAVAALTKDIIESKEYKLVTDYSKLFLESNEHNAESVFEVGARFGYFDQGGNQYGNTQGVRGSPNKGWGFCRPAYNLVSSFVAVNDPRMLPSILFLNEIIDGENINGDSSTPDTIYQDGKIKEIECYNQKVWVPGNDTRYSFAHNRRIIRYSDVLLMHAEALNATNKSSEALAFINEVRLRARAGNNNLLPDITTTNSAELMDAILRERNHELCLEGLRFHDLIRTGRAQSVLEPLGFIPGKNELMPIPQSEIDISQGKITQNPGYN